MIPLVLLFAQVDPLPPPPPPDPGQPFQPAQTAQPAPRPPPPTYRAAPSKATPEQPRPAPDAYVKPERPEPTPMPRRGFQLGIRTGVALPAGKLSENTAMAALASAQIPLFLDIGAKVSRYVFLGGYGSFALGGVSDRWDRNTCRGHDCASRSAHLGAQIQIHFGSFERVNPWIGYGIGYEWLWTSGAPETTVHGPEYGRFMAGFDFRLSHDWGLGPFVDATIGRYTRVTADDNNGRSKTSDIDDTAVHSWVTVGLRLVLFP